jgi:hypothetical protein
MDKRNRDAGAIARASVVIVYEGPTGEVVLPERGLAFARGVPVEVPADVAEGLLANPGRGFRLESESRVIDPALGGRRATKEA